MIIFNGYGSLTVGEGELKRMLEKATPKLEGRQLYLVVPPELKYRAKELTYNTTIKVVVSYIISNQTWLFTDFIPETSFPDLLPD